MTFLGLIPSTQTLIDWHVPITSLDIARISAPVKLPSSELFSLAIEIPFATSENGGSGLIKSITILDQTTTAPAMDIVFSSVNTSLAQDEGKSIGEDVADLDAALVNMLGVVKIAAGDYTNLTDSSLASKTGIDLGIQSASGSTSIFATAINRSGGNFVASSTSVLRMKVTIQKD